MRMPRDPAFQKIENRRRWLTLRRDTGVATTDELAELKRMPEIFYSPEGDATVVTSPILTEEEYEARPQPTFPWTNAQDTDKP